MFTNSVSIDFSKVVGKIKPMHAVNNGPVGLSVRQKGNKQAFIDAGIPYARLHDSSFLSSYGGEHIVDVHRIFKNFDADVNDPNSYDFEWTDKYIESIVSCGVKVFYRLGAAIEHQKKVGTQVPKDFLKWAKICEGIINHYTNGWANGYKYDIEYWEIWNEFDCRNADGSNPCWQGTAKEFGEFFSVVANYLNEKFPSLKIGGPAICNIWNEVEVTEFFEIISKNKVKLDFVSYHRYSDNVEDFVTTIRKANEIFDKYGYGDCEKILNEWNYIRGWLDQDWVYSLDTEKNHKGCAFISGVMLASQKEDLDMLMYYDARPCAMNGIFSDLLKIRKGYYSLYSFNRLYELKNEVESTVSGTNLYVGASTNDDKSAVMLSCFDDKLDNRKYNVNIVLSNLKKENSIAKIYVTNEEKDFELIKTKKLKSKNSIIKLKSKGQAVFVIEIE